MPIGGEAWGKSFAGFLGDDKVKQRYYSGSLANFQDQQLVPSLRALSDSAKKAGQRYAASVEAARPQSRQIAQENIRKLGKLANRYAYNDPFANYERVRSGNLSSLVGLFKNMMSAGADEDKRVLARLGYGGRGPSSFATKQRANTFSGNLVPAVNTIYRNLGPDSASLERSRLANLAATMRLMEARENLPLSTAYMDLLPYEAEVEMLAPQIAMSRDVGAGVRENTAGFRVTPNKWANFFRQQGRASDQFADFVLDAANTVVSAYTGGALGGIGGIGGIGGGGTGGGGRQPMPSQVPGGIRSLNRYGYPAIDVPSYAPPRTPAYAPAPRYPATSTMYA